MSYTSDLRAAHKPGVNKIVYSSAPYEGHEMAYEPRNRHDALPWVLVLDGTRRRGYRFSGRECHLQMNRYTVKDCGRSFAVVDTTTGEYAASGFLSRYAATDKAERLEASLAK